MEFLRVRMVETRAWDDNPLPPAPAIIGQPISDPVLDRAQLGTGSLKFENARYNPRVYDAALLDGLTVQEVYDMDQLRSTQLAKVVVNRAALPGPIIPVNLHPGAPAEQREPLVITQNGEATAVLQDIASYEQDQQTLALLKILALGNQHIAQGRTVSAAQAVSDIRRRLQSETP